MSKLGDRFFEIGRGYKTISDGYKRPYILGVDINDNEKPFIVAMGDAHYDFAACVISVDELLSDKWSEHIQISNCKEFVEKLKIAIEKGESFPQRFIIDLVREK